MLPSMDETNKTSMSRVRYMVILLKVLKEGAYDQVSNVTNPFGGRNRD